MPDRERHLEYDLSDLCIIGRFVELFIDAFYVRPCMKLNIELYLMEGTKEVTYEVVNEFIIAIKC